MIYKKLVIVPKDISSEDTLVVDQECLVQLDDLSGSIVDKSNNICMLSVRGGASPSSGVSLWLAPGFEWYIVEDDSGQLVLIPLRIIPEISSKPVGKFVPTPSEYNKKADYQRKYPRKPNEQS